MALTNTSGNRFGPSSYIVGPVLGDGCNFTAIQAAITQAVADGYNTANPTTILVRPGFYSSFTMAPGIAVEGVSGGSVVSNTAAITGNVTIDAAAAGGALYSLKNLNISDPGDAISTINAGPPIFVDIANCSVNGDRGIVLSNISGTFSFFNIRECRIVGTTTGLSVQEHNSAFAKDCTILGSSGVVIRDTGRLVISESTIDANTTYAFLLTGSNRLDIRNCFLTSVEEAIFGSGSDLVEMYHSTVDSTAASGNFIDAVNIFEFYDVAFTGTALRNNAIATNFIDWQPHASASALPTLPGAVRGTSAFDSAIFTVTDGWVTTSGTIPNSFPTDSGTATPALGVLNVLGGPGVRTFGIGDTLSIASVEFNDVAASQATVTDTGYFSTGVITLTMPAAPGQGELFEVGCVTAGVILQANAGQTIRIGNQLSSVAGTATSTDVGDSLIFRYNAANSRWHSMSVIGSWTLA